jgi:hypothetical protein
VASNLLKRTTGLNILFLTYLLSGDGTGRSLGLVEDMVGLGGRDMCVCVGKVGLGSVSGLGGDTIRLPISLGPGEGCTRFRSRVRPVEIYRSRLYSTL